MTFLDELKLINFLVILRLQLIITQKNCKLVCQQQLRLQSQKDVDISDFCLFPLYVYCCYKSFLPLTCV